ncbi:hypothetical protein D3C75_1011460 [compost metagenome]
MRGAATVIAHQQAQARALMLQAHPHLAGVGMPGDVGQGFLQQAVQMGLVWRRQRW